MAFVDYLVRLGTITTIFTILGLSLNLLIGYSGIMHLGHIALFGIAAYVSAILTLNGVPILVATIISLLVAAAVSLILGLGIVKLKGHYCAVATLTFVLVAGGLARNLAITKGALGLPGVPSILSSSSAYLVLCLAILAGVFLVSYFIMRSGFGRVLQALRDDEVAASVLGKNTFRYKMIIFVIASVFAAIAGVLYVHYIRFIDPEVFNVFDIVVIVTMVVVGGLATMRGALIGSVLVFLLPEPLRFIGLPPGVLGPLREILFAAVLLLVLLFKPRGLFGRIDLE